jgi:zinc protease
LIRNKAPRTSKEITPGNIEPDVLILKNSVPLYMIVAGSQPVIRLDILFNAGTWWQPGPLVATSAMAMLTEGTTRNSSKEIAEKLDYHGAYLITSADRDNAFVTIYFLEKHMDIILPLLADIVKEPAFPGEEFLAYRERRRQSFLIEKSRVSNLAREMFALAIYGPEHPYGQTFSYSDFDSLKREDLADFYARYFHSKNCRIVVSGNYNQAMLASRIEELFGGDWGNFGRASDTRKEKMPSPEKQIFVHRNDAVQSAIRIGRETFTRSHPDYPGMLVLNNLLGGHFGSRLMQNIREKKGYTYGIGSALVTLRNSGYIVILSEVGTRYRKKSLKEIYRELDKLCSKPVSKRELELTRSQMLGELLRDFDGPFARAESIRNLLEHDLDTGFYKKIISAIRSTGPFELLDLSARYLSPESMYEVVAGSE